MSDENFDIVELFRDLVYKRLGIHLSPDRKYILELKLNKMLLKDKTKDLKNLYEAIKNGDEKAFETLTHFITTNHTFFFRESEHFQILVNLIKKSGKKSPIIWSAATSTGEEVYSIIISLVEATINDFTVIASDIDTNELLK